MNTRTKVFFLALATILATMVNSQDKCSQFKCESWAENECEKVVDFSLTDARNISIQACPVSMGCPFDVNPAKNSTVACVSSTIRTYPGGSCSGPTDCLGGRECTGGVCVGKDACADDSSNCKYGNACFSDVNSTFVCKAQTNGTCEKDDQCVNTHNCYKGNCTVNFSLKDGSDNVKNDLLCASGYREDEKCVQPYVSSNTQSECKVDLDCQYARNGTNVTAPADSCTCGLNSQGKKYCKAAKGDKDYQDALTTLKALFLGDLSKCHAMERSAAACVERTKTDKSFAYRKPARNYANSNLKYLKSAELTNAETCAAKVLGFQDIVRPDKFKCAKYTCDTKGKSCVSSSNPMNEDGSGVAVNLTTKICNTKNETCYIGYNGINQVYQDESVSGECRLKESGEKKIGLRFPGEACTEKSDCYFSTTFEGKCENKVCVGQNVTQSCTKTEECWVGSFCMAPAGNSTGNSTCVKQKKEKEACEEGWDCANNLACYNKKCTPYYSIKTGDNVNSTFNGNWDNYKNLFCEYSSVDVNSHCSASNYTSTFMNSSYVDKNGYINCTMGSSCSYTDGTTETKQSCVCGYNADGFGYCPLPQSYSKFIYL